MIWAKESESSKKETVGLILRYSPEKFPFVVLWNLRRGFCNCTAAEFNEREVARLENGHSSREIIVLNLANLPQNDSCSLIS